MNYAKGVKGVFPTTVADTLDLLNYYKPLISYFQKKEEQISFVIEDESAKDHTNTIC